MEYTNDQPVQDHRKPLCPGELEKVSGGTEWIPEEEVPKTQAASKDTGMPDTTPEVGSTGNGMFGAGILDRAALQLDRMKESMTKAAVGNRN